jgi:hypothetical protein
MEPNTSGTSGLATSQCDLESAIRKFADSLKRDFAAKIAGNARAFKQRAVRLLRVNLPPGPGRPADELITKAERMYRARKSWKEIYNECIDHFSEIKDNATRQLDALNEILDIAAPGSESGDDAGEE